MNKVKGKVGRMGLTSDDDVEAVFEYQLGSAQVVFVFLTAELHLSTPVN